MQDEESLFAGGGAEPEATGEEALFSASDGGFQLELRAFYALHSKLCHQLEQIQDDFVTFPPSQWQVTGVEPRPFKELDERYAQRAVWGILDFVDQPGGAFVWLDAGAATRLCGLAEEQFESEEGIVSVETFLQHFSGAFMACWQDIAQFDVQMFPSHGAPSLSELQGMFPGLNANTPVITTAFRITQPGQSATGRVLLGIPQAYVLSLGASLRAVGETTLSSTDPSHFHERLAYMEDLPIPVSVLLGKAEMSVGDLQNLEEGDVIELDTTLGLPLEVRLGSTRLRGKPGTTPDGRRLCVQIVQSS